MGAHKKLNSLVSPKWMKTNTLSTEKKDRRKKYALIMEATLAIASTGGARKPPYPKGLDI